MINFSSSFLTDVASYNIRGFSSSNVSLFSTPKTHNSTIITATTFFFLDSYNANEKLVRRRIAQVLKYNPPPTPPSAPEVPAVLFAALPSVVLPPLPPDAWVWVSSTSSCDEPRRTLHSGSVLGHVEPSAEQQSRRYGKAGGKSAKHHRDG